MVRPLSVFLPLALAATTVNAQFGDFVKFAFGNIHQPFGAPAVPDAVVAKNSRQITTENWLSSVSVTVDPTADEDEVQEWIFYFTASPEVGKKNVTYWDEVFKDTVIMASNMKPAPKLLFGQANCTTSEASKLCQSFFLTAPYKLPMIYHIATYLYNGTTQIRRVPMWKTRVVAGTMPAYIIEDIHINKEWKTLTPWSGIFDPIYGRFVGYLHYLGVALRFYEMTPQWMMLVGLSILARAISSSATKNKKPAAAPAAPTDEAAAAPAAAPTNKSSKTSKAKRRA